MANVKGSPSTEDAGPPQSGPTVTHEQLINAVVNEVIRSRIRFRSLLRLLVSKGLLQISEFVEEYEEQEQESFLVLADAMLMNDSDLVKKHADWLNSERGGKFAVLTPGKNRPSLNLQLLQVAPSEDEQGDAATGDSE